MYILYQQITRHYFGVNQSACNMHCKAQTLSFQMIFMFFVVDQGSGLKNISNIFAEVGASRLRYTLV